MVASVQCLTVRFRSTQVKQSTQRFRHNIGSAFAFTKNYLFTTHSLLQELDPGFEVDGVWISHPADPLTKLVCKLRVLGSVQELDVAVLECDEFEFVNYNLRHTPSETPLVIYIAQRDKSLIPELRRGTAHPLRGPFEGLCCVRPMERCSGAPVLDSRGRVIGMLKSGASFATSDGLMHALMRIGISLDDDDYAEVESHCSLWELNKAFLEHDVTTLFRKRQAEEQGGRATKMSKKSTPSREGHEMNRAPDHGMNDGTNHLNDSSMLTLYAQPVLKLGETAHAKTTEWPSFPQYGPTALQNKHRLDENKSAYRSQSTQTLSAYRSPVVIKSEQSLENTVGYSHCNVNQPLQKSSFYQPVPLHKCQDSPGVLPPLRPFISTQYNRIDLPPLYQQQEMPATFTPPIYPNILATAPPITPVTFNGRKLSSIYVQPRTPSVPIQTVYHTTQATDSNATSLPPNRSVTRDFGTIDEPRLQHRHRQSTDEAGIRRWQPTAWDQFPLALPNFNQDALSSSRGYIPPTPTSMRDFSGSPIGLKSIRKSRTPRWRSRTRSRRHVCPSNYQLLDNWVPPSSPLETHQHGIQYPSEAASIPESESGDESVDHDPEAKDVDLDAEVTKDGKSHPIFQAPA